MRRILSTGGLVVALACSSVEDRPGCAVSTDCPIGQYCARAEGEARCWPDATPPAVTAVAAACAGGCVRDGLLRVEAVVEDDAEVLEARAWLDLDGGATSFALARAGATWSADVPLAALPFEAFSRTVTATVVARDGARNASEAADAAPVPVTRLRWTHDAGAPITSPAVMDDGTAVVGVSATSGQVLAVRADGTRAWALDVGGSAFVTAAPAVGERAIWVGSEDFGLRAVALDGSAIVGGVGVSTGGAIRGSVAVMPGVEKEWAFAASEAGFVGVASTASGENDLVGPTAAFTAGPVIGVDGRAYAATTAGALRAYRLNVSPAVTLTEAWAAPPSVGVEVSAGLAVDARGSIWTAAVEKLGRTVPAETTATTTPVATLTSRIPDSPAVTADGDVIVGDALGVLHRFAPDGTEVWAAPPNLGAAVHAPLVLAGGDAAFLVPTAGGRLFALRADGSEAWSVTLDGGRALRAPNLHTPPGQGANVTSTAYVASASGKLFAVVVDGALDGAAPWPKAFHDRRNTNRAGPQP